MSSFPEILVGAHVRVNTKASRKRLERMFDEHHDFIWRLLRRLGLSAERADDGAQQTFLVAAERIEDVLAGSERAFLFGSALRIAKTYLRTEHRFVLDGDMDHRLRLTATPEELCDHRRAVDLLDRALREMALDLRTVFILFELEGFSMVDIAALTEMPVGTVASRLRRARESLRGALADVKLGGPTKGKS